MSLPRTFSPPPSQSPGTGRPVFMNALSICSGPPPTCSSTGSSASATLAQKRSRSSWPGERPPGARWGIHSAPSPSSRAWSTSAIAGVDVVDRRGADADHPRLALAELGHRPVVGAGRAGGDLGVEADVEDDARAERGEDELAVEAELVEGLAALGGVERAERLVPLGAGEELVAEADLLVDDLGLVAP